MHNRPKQLAEVRVKVNSREARLLHMMALNGEKYSFPRHVSCNSFQNHFAGISFYESANALV